MAKGCCASVRYFMPDAPLCLLFDGLNQQVEPIARTYEASIRSRENVESEFLRKRSFGYGLTKMNAFWESPFETFLLIDADTVVVGDMREHANLSDFDMIVNGPRVPNPSQVERGFFNTNRLLEAFPGSVWNEQYLFNSGVILAKRGIFSLVDYEELLDASCRHPDLFKAGDQGLLNFLVTREATEKRVRFAQMKLQMCVGYVPRCDAERVIAFSGNKAALRRDRAIVLHYAGVRPYTFNKHLFTEPMTYFRQLYRNDFYRTQGRRTSSIRMEELRMLHPRADRALRLIFGNSA